ncbi:MAG: hypothetical protein FJX76_27735, partial [Armatimonadetes bacterium]|nr:hypothetical protein [Armatimonadota bacterium]
MRLLAAATIFLMGLAFVGSSASLAQDKPPTVQGEVQVGPGGATPAAPGATPAAPGAPATEAAPAADPMGPPVKRVWRRNPFVLQTSGSSSLPSAGSAMTGPVPGPTGKPAAVKPAAPPPPPPPADPTFALVGIMTSGGSVRALLVTGSGPREVKVGDKVDGYTVKRINLDAREVTVELANHAFRVGLPRESAYPAGPGGAPSAPGGAPAPG